MITKKKKKKDNNNYKKKSGYHNHAFVTWISDIKLRIQGPPYDIPLMKLNPKIEINKSDPQSNKETDKINLCDNRFSKNC